MSNPTILCLNDFDKVSMVINNTHSPDIKHISILDDKNESSVHFKLYHNELRNLANFILNYLDNNALSLKFSQEQVDDTVLKESILPEIGE